MKKYILFIMTAVMSWCMSSCINEEPLSSPVNNSGEGNISFTLGGSAGAKALTRGETPTAQDCEKHIDHLHVVAFKNGLLTAVVKDVVPDQDNNCVANVGGSGTMDIYFIANADADLAALIEALTVGTSTPADLEALIATQSPGEYEASDYTGKFLMVGMVGSVTVQASGATSTNIGTINLTRLAARIDIAAMPEGFTISSVQVCNYYTKSLLMRDGNTATMPETLGSPTDMTAVSLTNGDLPYTGRFFVYEDPTSQLEVVITGTYASKDVTAVVSFAAPSGGGAAAPIKRNSIYTISLAASSETSTVAELEGSITVKDWDEGATVTAQNSAIISNNAAPAAVAFDNLPTTGSTATADGNHVTITPDGTTDVTFDVVVTNASKGNISKLVCRYPVTGKGITISGGDFAADGVTQTFTVTIDAACAGDDYILEAQNVLKNTAFLGLVINNADVGVSLAEATKGMIIASNGKAYASNHYASVFGTKVAVVGIAGEHGKAIALVDAAETSWHQITNNGSNHGVDCTLASAKQGSVPDAPTGTTWKILTRENYSSLFQAMGSTVNGSSNGYVYDSNVNAYITAANGTAMDGYYLSTSKFNDATACWGFTASAFTQYTDKSDTHKVRPVLVW